MRKRSWARREIAAPLYLSETTWIQQEAVRRYHVLQGVCPKERLFHDIADGVGIVDGHMGCCVLVATACELRAASPV